MTRCAMCGHELVTDRLVSPTCGKAPCPCITDEDEACDPAIPASRVKGLRDHADNAVKSVQDLAYATIHAWYREQLDSILRDAGGEK